MGTHTPTRQSAEAGHAWAGGAQRATRKCTPCGGMSTMYFRSQYSGFYACATQVRIDSASNTRFSMIISINGQADYHGGLHVTEGNQGSSNYRTMRIVGTIYLNKGVTTSVLVYSQSDNWYRVQHESGFGCHMFGTGKTASKKISGFNADLQYNIQAGRGWKDLTRWRTNGNNELYETLGEFNNANGRFYPKETGYYLCNANIVINNLTHAGYTRLLIMISGSRDVNNGLHVIESNGGSTNYRAM